MRRGGAATGMAAAITLLASTAHATPSARLVYARSAGAESCPTEAELRRAVAARVGYDPFFAWAKKTIVARMATASPRGFFVSVNLVDEQGMETGDRVVRTEGGCAELLDVAALAIAIAIDPQSLVPQPRSTTPPIEPPPAPPPPRGAAKSRPTRAPTPEPTASPPLRLLGTVSAVFSSGQAPRPTAGAALGISARWTSVSLGLEGAAQLPVSARASGGGSVSAWLAGLALTPCAHADPIFLRAVAGAGSLQASGTGVLDGKSQSILWLAAGGASESTYRSVARRRSASEATCSGPSSRPRSS